MDNPNLTLIRQRHAMGDVTVMFTLPEDAFEALQAKARREEAAPGAILRVALSHYLHRGEDPCATDRSDPVFIGALRTLLARDLTEARDWADLESRLSARGYVMRLNGNQLGLFTSGSNECIADATEIGVSYGGLMRRLGGPMPHQNAKGYKVSGRG